LHQPAQVGNVADSHGGSSVVVLVVAVVLVVVEDGGMAHGTSAAAFVIRNVRRPCALALFTTVPPAASPNPTHTRSASPSARTSPPSEPGFGGAMPMATPSTRTRRVTVPVGLLSSWMRRTGPNVPAVSRYLAETSPPSASLSVRQRPPAAAGGTRKVCCEDDAPWSTIVTAAPVAADLPSRRPCRRVILPSPPHGRDPPALDTSFTTSSPSTDRSAAPAMAAHSRLEKTIAHD
jgi:hypothetical protein